MTYASPRTTLYLLAAGLLAAAACGKEAPATQAPASDVALTAAAARAFAEAAPDAIGVAPDGVALPVGAVAPDAPLVGPSGATTVGALIAGDRPLVLVFYRGGWCPYCSYQVRELVAAHDRFTAAGVDLAMVSVDRPEGAAATQAAYEVPFPLLTDPGAEAHAAFKVAHHLDAAMIKRLEGFGIDVVAWAGEEHHTIAVPSVFILDAGRKVLWRHAHLDYKQRPSAEAVLAHAKAVVAAR